MVQQRSIKARLQFLDKNWFTQDIMIKLYRYLILGACLLSMAQVLGQQVTLFNSSIINPYSINPSQAGENGNQLFLQHRNQWVGISGAPENTLLTTEWRLSESKAAIGFKMQYDVDNIIKTSSGYFTYAYHTSLGGKHSLSAGLSIGLRNNNIMFDRILVENDYDPVIFGYNQSGTKFDGDFGFTYKYDVFELQFSALQLFANDAIYYNSQSEEDFQYAYLRNFVSSASYTFKQVKDFEFTPIVQIRGMQGFNFQPEVILKAEYLNQFWVSGHYLHNRAVAFGMGLHFQDTYTISYAAEISTHDLAAYNGGTHEIVFGIKFGNAFERSETNRKLNKIQKSNNTYDERLEYLKRENNKLKKQVEEQQEYYEQMKDNSEGKGYNELKKEIEQLKKNQEELQSRPIATQEELQQLLETKAGVIEFENGKTVLKSASFAALDDIVTAFKDTPEAKIVIEGHTDNTGREASNQKISLERAKSVKEYLVNQGLDANQISVEGKGSSEPIANNATEAGRTANRRVDIKTLF